MDSLRRGRRLEGVQGGGGDEEMGRAAGVADGSLGGSPKSSRSVKGEGGYELFLAALAIVRKSTVVVWGIIDGIYVD
jgi:hypothetical protein